MTVKYFYLRQTHPKRVVTVARKSDGNNLYYQYAVCNPIDQFSKKEGRMLAIQRLEKNPIHLTLKGYIKPINKIILDLLENEQLFIRQMASEFIEHKFFEFGRLN